MDLKKNFAIETGMNADNMPVHYTKWLEAWIADVNKGMNYVGRWFSVEEKLPEPQWWLLVITKDKTCTIAQYTLSRNNWSFKKRWVFHGLKWPIDDVVAWTYLPSLPEKYVMGGES